VRIETVARISFTTRRDDAAAGRIGDTTTAARTDIIMISAS